MMDPTFLPMRPPPSGGGSWRTNYCSAGSKAPTSVSPRPRSAGQEDRVRSQQRLVRPCSVSLRMGRLVDWQVDFTLRETMAAAGITADDAAEKG